MTDKISPIVIGKIQDTENQTDAKQQAHGRGHLQNLRRNARGIAQGLARY